jgi:hypothetical protein
MRLSRGSMRIRGREGTEKEGWRALASMQMDENVQLDTRPLNPSSSVLLGAALKAQQFLAKGRVCFHNGVDL